MKKVCLLITTVLLIFLSSCASTEQPNNESSKIDAVQESLSVSDEVTHQTTLPTTIDGVTITWHSNISGTLDDNTFIQDGVDQNIMLTAVLEYNDITRYKYFDVTILLDPNLVTVPDPDDTVYSGYYAGLGEVTDDNLKQFLHDLIDDHIVLDYDALWNALANSDEDPLNPDNIILFYSAESRSEDLHGGDQDDWNREHVWPKSHGNFDNDDVMGSDMHHIRPTDVSVNGYRGNLDFDIGGTLVNETTDCFKDGDSFEPRDEVKGDVARMIFYMAVRYEGDIAQEIDLEVNDRVSNTGPYVGKLSILLAWHEADPVDAFERNRNDVIFSYQGNRNPFVDYPELVTRIFK
ncbi:MAG: endonuclease [Candidatus Izemoplasma sp.]|nr:endonuclease [Candidatus Izemoplasma sp.]